MADSVSGHILNRKALRERREKEKPESNRIDFLGAICGLGDSK
jgi:hypothetical protein